MFMDSKIYPIKMLILLKVIYRFNTISHQNSSRIFCRYRQVHSKIYVERVKNKQKKFESEK